MRSAEIREKFLKFFEEKGHTRVKSSSLVPAADPTLLFTNAGMVQFKDCFLGLKDPGYRRATTSQKCVRAGGKHNDLENVGFTPRHHTFFEMLGNFSFGDYFKKDAIAFAWELITEVYRIPTDRLRITVFEKDDEAEKLWKEQGVRPDWIYRLGEKDNFWAMGDTGPCGPCTEIYFDWGKEYCSRPDCSPACACGTRFLEIWNLVFMQFNRDASGKLAPLPKPSVDTGAGLERMAAVLQRAYSNYDTDLFDPIKALLSRLTHRAYGDDEVLDASMRVILDHIRSSTFLIADGVSPSNEGRGYVLRRILRRAIRYGKKLEQNQPFLFQLVPAVVQSLGQFYPEIVTNQLHIEDLIREEEKKFHETLHRGTGYLDENIAGLKSKGVSTIPAGVAFMLHDTYGFPLDLTQVIAREHKMDVDEAGFNQKMEEQRQKSGGTLTDDKPKLDATKLDALRKTAGVVATKFKGYEGTSGSGKLLLLTNAEGTEALSQLSSGETGLAVFDATPFYPEGGGQVGDSGFINGEGARASVRDAQKVADVTYHVVKVESGKLKKGTSYQLDVDSERRQSTAINHTSTHLMHAALRALPEVGPRVKQAGSLVTPDLLRFDFTSPRGLSEEEISIVEKSVNDEIQRKEAVTTQEMKFDEAVKAGALAFFDEKYGERVRVLRVGQAASPFSVELCGGTHLSNTAEAGVFKIISESSIASGTRRIVAYTGARARQYLLDRSRQIDRFAGVLKVPEDKLAEKIEALVKENRKLKSDLEDAKLRAAQGGAGKGNGGGAPLWEKSKKVGGLHLVTESVEGANPKILRSLVDQIRDKLKSRVVVALAAETEGKVQICVGITKDLLGELDAAKLVKAIADEVEGSGGGKADFAQAGGNRPEGLGRAFQKLEGLLQDHK